MFDLIIAALAFVSTMAAHIVYCRQQTVPGLQVKALVIICLIFLFLSLTAQYFFHQNFPNHNSLWAMPLTLTSCALQFLLLATYLVFYANTQLNSPSKTVLLMLKQEPKGLDDLSRAVTDDLFIFNRIEELEMNRCIVQDNGRWKLTASGHRVVAFCRFYQWVFARKMGG